MCSMVFSSFYIGFFFFDSKIMKGILNFMHLIIIFLIKNQQMCFPHTSMLGRRMRHQGSTCSASLAKYIFLPCHQKRQLALFLLVQHMIAVVGRFVNGDHFFSFFFSLSQRKCTSVLFSFYFSISVPMFFISYFSFSALLEKFLMLSFSL